MRVSKSGLLAICILSLLSAAVRAEDGPVSAFRLGVGADVGYAGLNDSVPTEVGKNGTQVDLKLFGSHQFSPRYLLDLGLGWSYTRVTGQTPVQLQGNWLRIGFLELSPRYIFNSRWTAGPYLQAGFGNDQSFAQTAPLVANQVSLGLYAGAQAFYELDSPQWIRGQKMRIGARTGTGLNIPDRQLYTFLLTFQMDLPFGGYGTNEGGVVEGDPSVWQEFEVVREGDAVTVMMSTEQANFATGSAELSRDAKEFLTQMGRMLAAHASSFGAIQIDGHTDVRGALAYNMKLSRDRAKSVNNALTSSGLPKSKVHSEGYGPNRPLDPSNNPQAWARNRRVEIRFDNVTDAAALSSAIQQIKDRLGR